MFDRSINVHSTREEIKRAEDFCRWQARKRSVAAKRQEILRAQLADLYEFGGEHTAVDKRKAKKFREEEETLARKIFKTENVYGKGAGWYNRIRIFGLRVLGAVNFVVEKLNQNLQNPPTERLHWLGFLGLLYGPMFILEFLVIGKKVLTPTKSKSEIDDNLSYWQCVKRRWPNVLHQEGRLKRLMNAGLWFTLNLITLGVVATAIGLSAPAVATITTCGFGLDAVHMGGWLYHDYKHSKNYQQDVEHKLSEKIGALHAVENSNERKNILKIVQLKKDIQILKFEKRNIQKDLTKLKINGGVDFLHLAIVSTGVAMMFFPPTLVPGFVLTCVGIVSSLGTRHAIKHKLSDYFTRAKKKPIEAATGIEEVPMQDLSHLKQGQLTQGVSPQPQATAIPINVQSHQVPGVFANTHKTSLNRLEKSQSCNDLAAIELDEKVIPKKPEPTLLLEPIVLTELTKTGENAKDVMVTVKITLPKNEQERTGLAKNNFLAENGARKAKNSNYAKATKNLKIENFAHQPKSIKVC